MSTIAKRISKDGAKKSDGWHGCDGISSCKAAMSDGVLCADDTCDYDTGVRSPPTPAQSTAGVSAASVSDAIDRFALAQARRIVEENATPHATLWGGIHRLDLPTPAYEALKRALSAAPVGELVRWQYRASICGEWSNWLDLHREVEKFRAGDWKYNLENGTCELRALYAGHPPAPAVGTKKVYIKPLRTIVEVQTTYAGKIRDLLNAEAVGAEEVARERDASQFMADKNYKLWAEERDARLAAESSLSEAVKAEREACAKVAEDEKIYTHDPFKHAWTIASTIRARAVVDSDKV